MNRPHTHMVTPYNPWDLSPSIICEVQDLIRCECCFCGLEQPLAHALNYIYIGCFKCGHTYGRYRLTAAPQALPYPPTSTSQSKSATPKNGTTRLIRFGDTALSR